MVSKLLSFSPHVIRHWAVYDPRVDNYDKLLTPGEVAQRFRVDPKTVTRWAAAGKLSSIRTPGGHRRFRESQVKALLDDKAPEDS